MLVGYGAVTVCVVYCDRSVCNQCEYNQCVGNQSDVQCAVKFIYHLSVYKVKLV